MGKPRDQLEVGMKSIDHFCYRIKRTILSDTDYVSPTKTNNQFYINTYSYNVSACTSYKL